MCDFTPVRNWLLVLLTLFLAALSSVIFALIFVNSPWPAISWTSFLAAAIWAGAATSIYMAQARPAVDAFCACVSSRPACATPCDQLKQSLAFANLVALLVAAVCAINLFTPIDGVRAIALVILVTAGVAAIFVCLGFAVTLGSCQSPPSSPGGLQGDPTKPGGTDNKPV